MNLRLDLFIPTILLASTLTACGGGGGSAGNVSTPPPPIPPTNVSGIWTDPNSTQRWAIVTQNNEEARFFNGGSFTGTEVQLVLSMITGESGSISATVTAFAGDQLPFMDGTYVATGTLAGTVVEGTSFQGDYSLNSGDTGTFSFEYEPLSEFESSLVKLEPCWIADQLCNFRFNPDGSFVGRDFNGCLWSGNANVIDGQYNAYGMTFMISGCPAQYVDDNGDYSGLAYIHHYPGNTWELLRILADNGQRSAPEAGLFR